MNRKIQGYSFFTECDVPLKSIVGQASKRYANVFGRLDSRVDSNNVRSRYMAKDIRVLASVLSDHLIGQKEK